MRHQKRIDVIWLLVPEFVLADKRYKHVDNPVSQKYPVTTIDAHAHNLASPIAD